MKGRGRSKYRAVVVVVVGVQVKVGKGTEMDSSENQGHAFSSRGTFLVAGTRGPCEE